MKAIIIPVLGLLVGLGGGIGAGVFLKPEEELEETEQDTEESYEAIEETEEFTEEDGETEFAKLANQFIVPVIDDGSISALVVLSVTLEVEIGASENVYSREPRLRDSFLTVLFEHANIGGFDIGFTEADTLSLLRRNLRDAARKALGSTVRDVLIVDIVRQEV